MQHIRKEVLDIKKILIIEDDLSLSNGIVLALKTANLPLSRYRICTPRSRRLKTQYSI